MDKTLDTEVFKESRRNFLKIAGISALGLAMPIKVMASSSGPAYPRINSGMTIDQFVEKYSEKKEISEKTELLIKNHESMLIKYSNEYHVPANLLSAVIANEHERGAVENVANKILDFANRYTSVNSSAGIAQIRASTALTLIDGLVRDKGREYLENMLHKDLGSFINKLHDSSDKKNLYESVKKLLAESDKLSIELAARFVSHLKKEAEHVHRIKDENFLRDPVAVSLIFRGYMGGERMMDVIDPASRKEDKILLEVSNRANDALSLLKTGSKINRIFGDEVYVVNPKTIFRKDKLSPEYQKVSESFKRAYNMPGGRAVNRSEELLNAYHIARQASRSDANKKIEYRKLAAYALYRASIELMGSGAKNVEFRNPGTVEQLGCNIKNKKGLMNIKGQLLPCLLKDYGNISRGIEGRAVDVPYFGSNIELPDYGRFRAKVLNWK